MWEGPLRLLSPGPKTKLPTGLCLDSQFQGYRPWSTACREEDFMASASTDRCWHGHKETTGASGVMFQKIPQFSLPAAQL